MNLDGNDIRQLNTALRDEQLIIENFDFFIKDADNSELKQKLEDIQNIHKNHASQLCRRIHQLGGTPRDASGIEEAIAEIKYKANPKNYIKDSVLETAIDGEEAGINNYNKVISKLADTSNIALVEDFLNESKDIIKELNMYE